ncbi:hypothetical protein J437_LFUL008212 [Ladona fulva]|uniref:SH2 domain-containing protein n=1 Tax=Ladona fulva TaxID=123851 RepID=A0A8K0P089_LADFU|nr:hypothetical protein J437_LFUL008212 [Ladona fulva]
MNVRISGSQSLESQSPIGSGPIKPNSIPGLGTKSDPPKRVIGTSEVELDKENGLHLRTMESSPSSDESNSPTEMNSYKRMTEKPPLIKRLAMMGVGSGFSPRGDESCPLVRQATSPTPPTSQSSPAGNSESPTKIPQVQSSMDMTQFKSQMKHRPMSGGYVNEAATSTDGDVVGSGTSASTGPAKGSTDSKQVTITKHIETDSKRPLQEPSPTCDDLKSKRISHVSSSSSSVPGITAPASTSSTASPVRNIGLSMTYTQQNEQTLRLTSQAAGGATSFLGCCTPPPLPERSDSLNDRSAEEGELRAAPWFQAGIPREITLEVLGQEPVGAFMVRESTSKPGCYALSLRVPRDFQQSGIAHYLIMRTNKGYKIKGFTKEFSTLTSLIIHHSVMPELLPCPLSLSRYNPSFINSDSNRDFADIDSDPDYNTLADFRKMMADLNV